MNSKSLNIYEAVAALIILFALHFFVAISFLDAGFSIIKGDPRNSVISVLSVGVLITLLIKFTNSSYREIFHLSNNSVFSTVGFTIIPIFFAVISISWWLSDFIVFFTSFLPEDRETIVAMEHMLSGGVVSIIAVCIVAPVIEEMLFRGVFLRGFLITYSPLRSIVYSSLLFAFVHLNIYQIPYAFILGLFIGWLYFISRSLWPCILAHAVNNIISYVMFSPGELETYNSTLSNIFSILVTGFSVYFLARIYRVRAPKFFSTGGKT